MYCILTEVDGEWVLPVTWVGREGKPLALKLKERTGLSYQKNITRLWDDAPLMALGVYKFEEPKVTTGYLETGSTEDVVSGFVVTRKKTWVADPDYVAPTPVSDLQQAKNNAVSQIKVEAHKRIITALPEWKQRNVIADLSSDDEDQEAAAATEWKKVTDIRTKSNELEASANGMDLDALRHEDLDWTVDEKWTD